MFLTKLTITCACVCVFVFFLCAQMCVCVCVCMCVCLYLCWEFMQGAFDDAALASSTKFKRKEIVWHIHSRTHAHTHIHSRTHMHMQISFQHVVNKQFRVAKTQDVLSCRSFFAKEPLIIGLFLRKMTYRDKASYDSTPLCIPESKWFVLDFILFSAKKKAYTCILSNKTTHSTTSPCCDGHVSSPKHVTVLCLPLNICKST